MLFVVARRFGATSRAEVKFQSVSWSFGRMRLLALTCAGWPRFPFQCTLTSAPVIPPSPLNMHMPSRASAQSTTNTWEDKCSVELNKQNPGKPLFKPTQTEKEGGRESRGSLSVTMADKPKWRHPDCPASCLPKTAPLVDRSMPEASSDASPDLTSILLKYRGPWWAHFLHHPYDCLQSWPPRGLDDSHKHRGLVSPLSFIADTLRGSRPVWSFWSGLIIPARVWLLLPLPPSCIKTLSHPSSLLCQIFFDSSPAFKSLVFIIPRVIMTWVLTRRVPVLPVPTGLSVMAPC